MWSAINTIVARIVLGAYKGDPVWNTIARCTALVTGTIDIACNDAIQMFMSAKIGARMIIIIIVSYIAILFYLMNMM